MSGMNWDRAKRRGAAAYGKSGDDRYLERAADRLLKQPAPVDNAQRPKKGKRYSRHAKRRRPVAQIADGLNEAQPAAAVDGARYRSVGSVAIVDGEYRAVDAAGNVLGTYATRAEAWRRADQLGVRPI